MAEKRIDLRRNADRTWTVRVKSADAGIEHVGEDGKTRGELFDAIKYAIRSKGVYISDIDLLELIEKAK